MNKYSLRPQNFSCAIVLYAMLGCTIATAQTTQEHVHHMGHNVMPFDLSKTTHIFQMTESGGVERIIIRDASARDQVTMIQQHLQLESIAFQRGDYSDPASLHGANMPGLQELRAGASQVKVSYSPLSTGAEIIFTTTDIKLLTAVHRWFGAQLSEHGADAKAE